MIVLSSSCQTGCNAMQCFCVMAGLFKHASTPKDVSDFDILLFLTFSVNALFDLRQHTWVCRCKEHKCLGD